MIKHPTKKRKYATARPSTPKPNAHNRPTKTEAKASPATAPPLRPRRQQIGPYWKEFWAYAGPILSLVGAWFLLSPQIEITPSVTLDSSQPLSTQFTITNKGHVPVYNMHFSYGLKALKGSVTHIGHLRADPRALMPVPYLWAGGSVTRGFAIESEDIRSGPLEITAFYQWPLIRKESSTVAYFTILHGVGGFFLVPDES